MFGEMIVPLGGGVRLFILLIAGNAVAQTEVPSDERAQLIKPSPSRQELLDRARYWEDHGRKDIAERLRLQTGEEAAAARDAPTRSSVETDSSMQGQDEGTSYWEAKGRSDLAEKLRQKQRPVQTGDLLSQPLKGERTPITRSQEAKRRKTTLMSLEDSQLEPDNPGVQSDSPATRNQKLARLQKMAWAHVQIDRAEVLVRQGRNAEAELLLRQVALELSINTNQLRMAEWPLLWNPAEKGQQERKSTQHKSNK